MKKIIYLALPLSLFALSPFETPQSYKYDLSSFNTKPKVKVEVNGEKVVCRFVCDKQVSKEKKIAEAIHYYKKRK